jgi:hypothetical protein
MSIARAGAGSSSSVVMAPRAKSPHLFLVEDRGFETPCWIWQRALNSAGYGVRWRDGKLRLAHRDLYEQEVGVIPPGLELDHLCEVTACVRPSHMEPVTHAENLRRGRSTKLSLADVVAIRAGLAAGEKPGNLGARHGVTGKAITDIRLGRRWVA